MANLWIGFKTYWLPFRCNTTVRAVCAHAEIQIDVRVIAATNRNLAREVAAGRFREDLFYRIAVLAINTPPLRDRASDIPLLMQYFQHQTEQKFKSTVPGKVEDDAVDALFDYSWPGNVRQLRHVVEKLVVGTLGDSVINADAVRRALDNHPHVELCSANGRQPFAAYIESDSLDDFLDHAMLDLMTCCGQRQAAITKLPANCRLSGKATGLSRTKEHQRI